MLKNIIRIKPIYIKTKFVQLEIKDYIQDISDILSDSKFSEILENKFKAQYLKLKKWTKSLHEYKKESDDFKVQLYLSKIYRLLKKLDNEVRMLNSLSSNIKKRHIKLINRSCSISIRNIFCGNGGIDYKKINTSSNRDFIDEAITNFTNKMNTPVKINFKENISNFENNIYEEILCRINPHINIIKENFFILFNLLILNLTYFFINKEKFYKPKICFELKSIRGRAPNHPFLIV